VSSSSGVIIEPSPRAISQNIALEIYYTHGACHAEWGRTNIWIDGNGKGLYESGSGSLIIFENEERFEHEMFRKMFVLNETELLGLVDELERSEFYSLNDRYYDPEVIDGYCATISVTRDNVAKSVSVANAATPEAYNDAAMLIEGIAENKTHPANNERKNLESLIEALEDNDSDVRSSAAWLLGDYGDPDAVDALIGTLKDNDSYVRWKAAEALGKLNDKRAVDSLVQALGDRNEWVRKSAAEALGMLHDYRAVGPLIQALEDENREVRYLAIQALGNLKDPEAVDPLIEALNDNDSYVREKAIEALGNLNDTRAIAPLTQVLDDENEVILIRDAAADALKKLGRPVA
jgi:HEAT repeat protein